MDDAYVSKVDRRTAIAWIGAVGAAVGTGVVVSGCHPSQAVKDFLKRGASKRLHLERLPGYAPDLNLDEGIWNYLKRVELANSCCHDLNELRTALIRARERLRHKSEVIHACSRQCGYSL